MVGVDITSLAPIDNYNPAFAEELGLLGSIPTLSCFADNRFSYHLFVPPGYFQLRTLHLLIAIHGSARDAHFLRDEFTALAQKRGCVILAPIFPSGMIDPNDRDGYKTILSWGIRYDYVLLSMVDEVHARYPKVEVKRFLLHGFSGGAQYVHRFAYLHPERLLGISIGAPGTITMIDQQTDFPRGLRNLEDVFGKALDWVTLKHVPALFVAGEDDTSDLSSLARGRPSSGLPDGRFGGTRRLEKSWKSEGADSRFVAVKNAKHEEDKMLPHVKAFFSLLLEDLEIQNMTVATYGVKL